MDASIKSAALKACKHFLVPIARFLLGIGISYREFAEISKLAFVKVASDDFGIKGRRTNISRVSVMTGLTRKEIRNLRVRLESEDWALDRSLSRPVLVLSQWYTNPRYLARNRTPKALSLDSAGQGESFTDLVKEVGGDLPPKAMLTELQCAGCVQELSSGKWKPTQRHYSPRGIDFFQVQRFGECLHDLSQTITSNYMKPAGSENRLFEFRAWSDRVDPRAIEKLRKIVSVQGREYLDTVDDWLSEHSIPEQSENCAGPVRCGVGVYYFETPSESVENG